MAYIDDADVAEIREYVHEINNALNVISMQSELVKALARDCAAAERIAVAIDTVLVDCQKAGELASDISRKIKAAG